MSLYDVTVNSTGLGRAGTTKMIVVGFFQNMTDAKKAIGALVYELFLPEMNYEIEIISHSNTIYPADVLNYERIVIIE